LLLASLFWFPPAKSGVKVCSGYSGGVD